MRNLELREAEELGMKQAQLFEDHTKWHIGRRAAHVVCRRDATGYTVRIRWSQKLGLQLDHVFITYAAAQRKARDIELLGFIKPVYWKRIFNPKWTPSCETIRSVGN